MDRSARWAHRGLSLERPMVVTRLPWRIVVGGRECGRATASCSAPGSTPASSYLGIEISHLT